jgi:porin
MKRFRVQYWIWAVLAFWTTPISMATPPLMVTPTEQPATPATTQPTGGAGSQGQGFIDGLSRSTNLLGDMGGIRPQLSKFGVSLNISETSEGLGNITGGAKQGFEYDGLTQMVLQVDTQRAVGFYGGLFNVSGLQIHGRNLSQDNLYTLQTASGIEGDRSTRLWELWYQQKFLDEDRLDVKIGQQSLDQEFMVSQNALVFVNTMFGWPLLPSEDLPGGGPAYPLSTPGVRFRARPTDAFTLLVGAFNGSPVYNNTGDPQERNPSGTNFSLDGGVLAIAEVQWQYPSLGTMVYADSDSDALAGTYRLGFWYDSESFADQQFANQTHHGDMGIYAVADQMVWHSTEDPDHAISIFCRAMGTPQTSRNLVEFSLNFGLTLHDPIPHRDDDTLGIGMGFGKVSGAASDADRLIRDTINPHYPVRSDETFVELTYQYQFTPWCQLQPDFQYVFNPGAGVLNPNQPVQRIKNEAVLGLRVNILF